MLSAIWRRVFGPTNDAERSRAQWENGRVDEQKFWESWLADTDAPGMRFRLDPATQLQPSLDALLDSTLDIHRILDVGSGPLTNLGRNSARGALEIVLVDPLADEYHAMLARHRISSPHRLVAMTAEELDVVPLGGPFDLVFSNNALDHAHDPARAIVRMIDAAKLGAAVVVQVSECEGRRAGYTGLHQWDFLIEKGRLFLSSPRTRRIDLCAEFAHRAQLVELSHIEMNPAGIRWNHPHIRMVLRRLA